MSLQPSGGGFISLGQGSPNVRNLPTSEISQRRARHGPQAKCGPVNGRRVHGDDLAPSNLIRLNLDGLDLDGDVPRLIIDGFFHPFSVAARAWFTAVYLKWASLA